jgi:hypothetical protein
MTKTIYVLPFGLGSVLTFLVADRSLQRRFLPAFTTYVNFAVYVKHWYNSRDSRGDTLGGIYSKITYVALFV